MNLPLAMIRPDLASFDADEIELACDGAYDLVLIENASELFREAMMKDEALENVIRAVIKSTGRTCQLLRPETFDIQPNDRKVMARYSRMMAKYRKTNAFDPKKCAVSIVALGLDGGEGHYGVIYYSSSEKSSLVFDSMVEAPEGSGSTEDFLRIAADMFRVPARLLPCPSATISNSLQLTGGFPRNTIAAQELFAGLIKSWANDPNHARKREAVRQLRRAQTQSTESQNHFCYMWSIWAMHLFLLGYTLDEIIQHIQKHRIDPLFVIKRYIYGLVKVLDIPVEEKAYFRAHFPSVWTNAKYADEEAKLVAPFHRYRLEMKSPNTIRECLEYSLDSTLGVGRENTTPIPESVREIVKC